MGILGALLMIPAMFLLRKIFAQIERFSFWFCRNILPRANDVEPISEPQTAREAREILKKPREEFFEYLSRSCLFTFFFEVLTVFLFWLLISLFVNSLENDFSEKGYDLGFVLLFAIIATAIPGFCFLWIIGARRK